jgi:hypothetical protein
MAFSFLSFELITFVSVLYLYMQVRKTSILSLRPAQGLTVYVPPKDEDFEMLEKSNKSGRENKKGEVNKYDKKKLPSKAKFPLRTITMNEEFVKVNQEFFVEYDFFFMLFTTVLAMFVITQTTKLIFPALIETNLIFYMIVFMLLMTFMNLTRHTFQQGYLNFADDTKVEMLFGIKAFIITFVFLSTWGTTTFFDFDLEKAHDATMQRVNLTMQLMGG